MILAHEMGPPQLWWLIPYGFIMLMVLAIVIWGRK